jgi:hypothetical protein
MSWNWVSALTMSWNWGSALTGGLAGSVLTLFIRWISHLWCRPKLKIIFTEAVDGCATNIFYEENEPTQRWLRIQIKNTGRSTAFSVSGSITQLTLEVQGGGKTTVKDEVFDVRLAHHDFEPFPLAPGAHRFLDVAHTEKRNPSCMFYEFRPGNLARHRLRGLGSDPGNYGATIFVTADNAKPVRSVIRWSWNRTFLGLSILAPPRAPWWRGG